MKTNLEKNMEQILNLPTDTKPIAQVIDESRVTPMNKPSISDDEVMDDYYYARENLKSIIDNAQQSIDDLSSIASTSESPRAYEVLSTLMKTIVEANKDLLELQRKVKQIKEDSSSQPQNVTNALFVGSTSELQKLIKQQSE
jgi:gas vesicle protein